MAQVTENEIGMVTFKIDPSDNFFTAEGYFHITNLSNYSSYDFFAQFNSITTGMVW